jgi:predicted Zn-dependent protease
MLSKLAIRRRLVPCLFSLLCFSPCHAETGPEDTQQRDAEQRRGVELARAGHYDAGLAVLNALLDKYPGYYPAQRDIVVITAWKGDCRAAVRRFEPIRHHPDPEPYLILPVSECLMKLDRLDEAVSLLEEGQQRLPDNHELASAYAEAQARRAAQPLNELRYGITR